METDRKRTALAKDGAYVVLSEADLTIIHEARDSKQPISDVKFSPDGATLALSSHDRCIYLYNVGDFATTAKCRGHKGRIEHLDWSEDSKYLQSTDDAGELLFWEVESGEQRTAQQATPAGLLADRHCSNGIWCNLPKRTSQT